MLNKVFRNFRLIKSTGNSALKHGLRILNVVRQQGDVKIEALIHNPNFQGQQLFPINFVETPTEIVLQVLLFRLRCKLGYWRVTESCLIGGGCDL